MSTPTDADLIPFGYAPGAYMMRCRSCGVLVWNIAKYNRNCRPCAAKAWTEHNASYGGLLVCDYPELEGA